ncbi:SH3 domain-containing protein [Tenacibaculum jejuense]|uniref:SH3b domain-containing protein n=1 Tax=Tenacibaculum jejuense TaxID=584609 RepID=A0A238UA58_9FLAO|nr:SH3 domain-containing protein [Tenacibaculum jejuense]SNR16093.1 protein of unknown function [Tenacibaculum jejuense]
MKFTLLFFMFLYVFIPIHGQSKEVMFHSKDEFSDKDNAVAYVFGDKVKLRSMPNVNSEVLAMLRISDKVTVLSGGAYKNTQIKYNGIKWFWSKIEYQGVVGYVLNGLLSQTTSKTGNTTYLTSLKKEGDELYILIRAKNEGFNYFESKLAFSKWDSFTIEAFNDRGVPSVNNMIKFDVSHNISRTEYYFFNTTEGLKKAIELRHHEDGGSYLFHEVVTFPNEKDGEIGKIKYQCYRDETGKSYDDVIINFVWKGEELKSNINVMETN